MSNDNFTIKPSLINAWSARLAEPVPFCPCPPETLDCAFKSDLSKVDGGIPIDDDYIDSLTPEVLEKELPFCSSCSRQVFRYELDLNKGLCNFCAGVKL